MNGSNLGENGINEDPVILPDKWTHTLLHTETHLYTPPSQKRMGGNSNKYFKHIRENLGSKLFLAGILSTFT